MEIEYLDNIDFEPLIILMETGAPCNNFGNSVVTAIKEWEEKRPKSCNCHKTSLEIFLFYSNEHRCKVGLEWVCLDVCIPSLSETISKKIRSIITVYVGEKHVPSSSKSYAYISIFGQTKENILEAASTSGYCCFVDYDELESFIFIKELEIFNFGQVIKAGISFSKNLNRDFTIWRNLSDDILEIYFFKDGKYAGFVSTSNAEINESMFKKARTKFPEDMAAMFKAKKPKSKWDLHYGIASYSEYNIESIGLSYSKIINGKYGLGRDKSDYIHYQIA